MDTTNECMCHNLSSQRYQKLSCRTVHQKAEHTRMDVLGLNIWCVSQLSEEELDTEEHAPGGAEAEVIIPDIGLLIEVLNAILSQDKALLGT